MNTATGVIPLLLLHLSVFMYVLKMALNMIRKHLRSRSV